MSQSSLSCKLVPLGLTVYKLQLYLLGLTVNKLQLDSLTRLSDAKPGDEQRSNNVQSKSECK